MGEDPLQTPIQCAFLEPDAKLQSPDQAARARAAGDWKGLRIIAHQRENVRAKAYFQDATGPGFYLPGCTICVSQHARSVLEAALGDQALFLPVDIVGAPMRFWILYATRYYDKIDVERSRVKTPAAYVVDRRLELREPYFLESADLEHLYLFRVAGSADYVPFALGDYVTQRFVDLVDQRQLGGFSFMPVVPYGAALAPGKRSPLISRGPKYRPLWQLH